MPSKLSPKDLRFALRSYRAQRDNYADSYKSWRDELLDNPPPEDQDMAYKELIRLYGQLPEDPPFPRNAFLPPCVDNELVSIK